MNKAIFADSYCPYPLGTICDSLRASNRILGFLVSVVLPGEPTGLLYGTHILVSSHKIGKGAGLVLEERAEERSCYCLSLISTVHVLFEVLKMSQVGEWRRLACA